MARKGHKKRQDFLSSRGSRGDLKFRFPHLHRNMDCDKRDLVQSVRRHFDIPLDFLTIPSPAAQFTVQPGAGASTGGRGGGAATVGCEEIRQREESDVVTRPETKSKGEIMSLLQHCRQPPQGDPVCYCPFG